MTEVNIHKLLACLGISNGISSGEWVRASCPLAFHRHRGGKDSKPSFGIHIEPAGKSGYLCYSCQIHSRDLSDLVWEITYALKFPAHSAPPLNLKLAHEIIESEDDASYVAAADWSQQPVVQEFDDFPLWWLESFPSVFKSSAAMAYLNGRDVPTMVWGDLDLRFDFSRQLVCFPYFNKAGLLAGMRGRSIVAGKGKFQHFDYSWNGRNNSKLVLLNEHRIDWKIPVVVVEGEFDLCRVVQVYPNVVASLGATLSEPKLEKLELAVAVVGFMDNDMAGKNASHLMQKRFGHSYSEAPYPDDMIKDPGEMTLTQVQKALAHIV